MFLVELLKFLYVSTENMGFSLVYSCKIHKGGFGTLTEKLEFLVHKSLFQVFMSYLYSNFQVLDRNFQRL